MKTIAADSELDSELQELYIVSNHWLSDLHFAEDEMKFLKLVINKYLVNHTGNNGPGGVKLFDQMIVEQEVTALCVKNKILDLLKVIEPFVKGKGDEIGLDLIEKFSAIEKEMKALFESVKQIKKSLFGFAEDVMKLDCQDFTRQFNG